MAATPQMPVIEVKGGIRFPREKELRRHLKHIFNHHQVWKDIIQPPGLLELARGEWGPEQRFEGEEFPLDRPLGPNTRKVAEWYEKFLSGLIEGACTAGQHHLHHVDYPSHWRQVVIVWKKDAVIWTVAKAIVRDERHEQYVLSSGFRVQWDGHRTGTGRLLSADELDRKILDYAEYHEVNNRLLAVHDPEIQALR